MGVITQPRVQPGHRGSPPGRKSSLPRPDPSAERCSGSPCASSLPHPHTLNPAARRRMEARRFQMKPFGNHRVGLPTPIADILTDCFPVAPKSQSLSYGPAVALSSHLDENWSKPIRWLGAIERNNHGTPKRHAGTRKTDPTCKAFTDVLASHVR